MSSIVYSLYPNLDRPVQQRHTITNLEDLPTSDLARTQEKLKVVGVLFGGSKGSPAISAFADAMQSLGYQDGKSILLQFRYADGRGEKLPLLARQLAAENPNVIVAIASDAAVAAAGASTTIPIVSASGDIDFVDLGFARSLEQPAGNVTGVIVCAGRAAQLRVGLLKEAIPALSMLAVLMHPANSANRRLLSMMDETARQHGVKLRPMLVSKPDELQGAMTAAKTGGAQAVSSLQGPFFFFQRVLLGELSEKLKIPIAVSEPLSAEAGALLQVNPDMAGAAAASAGLVDRILKGAQPGDLPFERHPSIQVIFNLKVARSMNVNIGHATARGAGTTSRGVAQGVD